MKNKLVHIHVEAVFVLVLFFKSICNIGIVLFIDKHITIIQPRLGGGGGGGGKSNAASFPLTNKLPKSLNDSSLFVYLTFLCPARHDQMAMSQCVRTSEMTADEVITRFKDKMAQLSPALRKAFLTYDKQNKGRITRNQFRAVRGVVRLVLEQKFFR